ncbi:MAG: hypothetical protein MR935_03430 [Agathobaculum sp.]|uniref:hypothetical protein n=1 Tax=Agathobaculum sp. TaxID=2048138 RepID=UPI0025BA9F68|nr:hypothetical protein [Agathobaculum sp.]MCI7125246.1 hypothetical protein [Agathobaculum sp.]MDY3711185.1 hypothetical protein [Agathobaculum sp.]
MAKKQQQGRTMSEKAADTRRRVRRRLTVRGVLSALIVATLIRSAFMQRFENVFVCVLALILFTVPMLLEKQLAIDIPPVMEGIIYCFIYAAEILGEINSFYTIIPGWDTMLHTINGFLFAAVGFALVDLFNRSKRFTFELSPLFLAIVAFCFSMTIGVLWEFFEFGMDQMLGTDMQKDFVVQQVNSVLLNPDGLNIVEHETIDSLFVNGQDWMEFPGGYIDIGLIDTMKDLQVNFIGAVAFSIIGFFYVKRQGKGKFAAALIPVVRSPDAAEKNAPRGEQTGRVLRPTGQNDNKGDHDP